MAAWLHTASEMQRKPSYHHPRIATVALEHPENTGRLAECQSLVSWISEKQKIPTKCVDSCLLCRAANNPSHHNLNMMSYDNVFSSLSKVKQSTPLTQTSNEHTRQRGRRFGQIHHHLCHCICDHLPQRSHCPQTATTHTGSGSNQSSSKDAMLLPCSRSGKEGLLRSLDEDESWNSTHSHRIKQQ